MSSPLPRRTLTKGALWSVPALAVASSAPALAASSTCYLTETQLNSCHNGPEVAQSWHLVGARTYSHRFGGLANAKTTVNFGFRSDCNYRGSVTFKARNAASQRNLPAASITLADGTVYYSDTVVGHVASGGAKVGFDCSMTFTWAASAGSSNRGRRDRWRNAVLRVPLEYSYTSPGGKLCKSVCLQAVFTLQNLPWDVAVHSAASSGFEYYQA
nr:hypothetical protein [Actinomyces sp.]